MFQRFLHPAQFGFLPDSSVEHARQRTTRTLRGGIRALFSRRPASGLPTELSDHLRADMGLPQRRPTPYQAAWHFEQSALVSVAALPPYHR